MTSASGLPKFTVVIATYNADKTLDACLDSVRSQTYLNHEVIVADGLSKDGTLAILRRRESEIAWVISEKDKGIYDAWNKIIPRATGDWLIFLGADDELWDANVFAEAALLLANASENIIYGKVGIALPDKSILNFEGVEWNFVSSKFQHEMTLPHQGVFHRRTLFEKNGLFNPAFRICGDYEFLLRDLKDHPARFLPNLVVSRMAMGGVSSTYRNVPTIIRELSLARKLNGYHGISFYILMRWARYYLRAFIRIVFGERASHVVADLFRRITGKPALWTRPKT